MRRIPLRIEYADGRIDRVTCIGADSVAFERQYDRSSNEVGQRLEFIWFVGWVALKREGRTSLDFESWILTVGQVGDDETVEDTEIRPLESQAPIGGSATLPMSSDSLLL